MSQLPTPKATAQRPVRYHLRIGLTTEHHAAQVRKLWQLVRRIGVDEIMFFAPHAEECSAGLGTARECEQTAALLKPLFARCRRMGVTPSINIWWTVSFSNMPTLPRDQRKQFDFRWAVSLNGKVSHVVACPRCPQWRRETQRVYRTFARLKPGRFWIDDDTRTTLKADLFSPCFCDVCLEEMAKRTGRKRGRTALFKAIMADPKGPGAGQTNSVRNTWMEFQAEMMQEIITGLTQAVHGVSPETDMGLMLGESETHFTEGRRYGDAVAALASAHPYVRPGIGPYIEGTPVEVAEGLGGCRREVALLPSGTTAAPEIENYPHSRFRKSMRLARVNLAMGQLLGLNEVTLCVYPFTGRIDLNAEGIWAEMFRAQKPFLQGIADLGITPAQHRGVALPIDETITRFVRGAGDLAKPILMYRQRPWDSVLPILGIATSYRVGSAALAGAPAPAPAPGSSDISESHGATENHHAPPVVVLGAEQVSCLDDATLESVFSRGVVLDARAAELLVLRGRGELAGLVRRIADAGASLETVEDKAFGGPVGTPNSVRYNGLLWQFELHPKARVVSRLRGYHREKTGHGVVLFENALGGRTVLYPFDSQATAYQIGGGPTSPFTSGTFLTWQRQAQLLSALEWAGRAPVPLFVPEAPCLLPLLIAQEKRLIVGAINAHPDPVASVRLRLAVPGFLIRKVRRLRDDGSWLPCPAKIASARRGVVQVDTGTTLNHHDVGVFVLE